MTYPEWCQKWATARKGSSPRAAFDLTVEKFRDWAEIDTRDPRRLLDAANPLEHCILCGTSFCIECFLEPTRMEQRTYRCTDMRQYEAVASALRDLEAGQMDKAAYLQVLSEAEASIREAQVRVKPERLRPHGERTCRGS